MKRKPILYTEAAYILGLAFLALGAALMEKADFGMSMVVAPAYLIHRKVSETLSFYSFGMSEYVLQAVLLAVMSVVLGRFKKSSLFSFVTAVIYGFILDGMIRAVGLLPGGAYAGRAVYYIAGVLLCSLGVSLLFHTYLPPEAYELFVKELSAKYGWRIDRVKTVYDCCSCLAGVALSFLFFGFGRFEGVKLGTILCALINGWLIGRIGALLESRFRFQDGLSLRTWFSR